MTIYILSRGPYLYSTRRLREAAEKRGHEVQVIDHTRCSLFMGDGRVTIHYDGAYLSPPDAVIPRIGASVTAQGAAVVNHLEAMGIFTVARAEALQWARNKLRCLQMLAQHGIDTPRTALATGAHTLLPLVEQLGGLPVVIKLNESTHGVGVMLTHTLDNAAATLEAFQRLQERVLIQEFIAEAGGADIRAFVVGGKIVSVIKRQAPEGEFRSNLHRGAVASPAVLSEAEARVVKASVRLLGLDVAGVDLLRSRRGPLIMEVNASPGLEGVESTTGVDIAGLIIKFIESKKG